MCKIFRETELQTLEESKGSEEYLVENLSLRDWRYWLGLSVCEVGEFGLRL